MLKKIAIASICLLSPVLLLGATGVLNFDFIAPIVASDADVPAQAGLIYYDVGVGLKIINPSGVPETISNSSGAPITSGSGTKIEHARVNNSGGTPTVVGTPVWITLNTDNGAGDVTFNLIGFATTPSCVCTAIADDGQCTIDSTTTPSNSLVRVQTRSAAGGAVDKDIYLICFGS